MTEFNPKNSGTAAPVGAGLEGKVVTPPGAGQHVEALVGAYLRRATDELNASRSNRILILNGIQEMAAQIIKLRAGEVDLTITGFAQQIDQMAQRCTQI